MNALREVKPLTVSKFDLLCEISDASPRGLEATEVVLGPYAFIEIFGSKAPREGNRFMDLPVKVDIKMVNPHGFRIETRAAPVLFGFQQKSRSIEALAFALISLAVGFWGYVILVALGVAQ